MKKINVSEFMSDLNYSLKSEVEILREVIKNINPDIHEQIKWNAPSYSYKGADFLTFNLRDNDKILLVFHHPEIVNIKSDLLKGDYKDRRLMYIGKFEVENIKDELVRIISEQLLAVSN